MLRDEQHDNLVLTTKEYGQLQELVKILSPFAAATYSTQGSKKTVTISCVIPIILSLNKYLGFPLLAPSTFTNFVKTHLQSLHDRFAGIFTLLGVALPYNTTSSPDFHFNSSVVLMAAALDPAYGFNWIQDQSGSEEDKEALKYKITGLYFSCFLKIS